MAAADAAIEAVDVTKVYRRYAHKRQFATLKSALVSGSLIRDLNPEDTFEALKGVSFSVPAGCTYAIIGRNGSGKSTMLKCVAGITRPTTGRIAVRGRISALIELGAGFHPEISGRENVFINGIMLGLTKREIARRFDEIVEFAELAPFIDAPVKTYSSGMYMRLGFAVAINVDPDVLLVDEVLAVGDEGFTHKCLDKFSEFRRRGKTILLVTHSLGLVERFCDEALWIDDGVGTHLRRSQACRRRVRDSRGKGRGAGARHSGSARARAFGDSRACRSRRSVSDPVAASEAPNDMFRAQEGRWGTREIEITSVQFIGADGQPTHVFRSGDPMTVQLTVTAREACGRFCLRHRDLQR